MPRIMCVQKSDMIYPFSSFQLWLNKHMLYIVSTPIGNLGDITLRALETLRAVDLIASEDTRKTGRLLKHFEISKPQISFFEGNESKRLSKVMAALEAGQDVALVSNAGTPVISDPGFKLVRAALAAGVEVTSIPGPSALTAALVLSGLPVHSFTFRGFPPRKPGKRKRFLEEDVKSNYTLIYYESPHRLMDFLKDAMDVFGDRDAAIANDLTKKFEAVYRGRLSGITLQIEKAEVLGEYVVLIAGKN